MTDNIIGCSTNAALAVPANAARMLTVTLEIEGLLMLLQRRGDLVNPEVADLLRQKVSALAALAGIDASETNCVCEPSAAQEEVAEAAVFEETEDALPDLPEARPASESPVTPAVNPVPEKPVVPEKPIAAEKPTSVERIVEPASAPAPDAPAAPARNQVAFTLNDKFRFRRELFADSDADFQAAVATAATMTSAAEIEEYLADDLCLDLQNPTAAEFLTLLTEHL